MYSSLICLYLRKSLIRLHVQRFDMFTCAGVWYVYMCWSLICLHVQEFDMFTCAGVWYVYMCSVVRRHNSIELNLLVCLTKRISFRCQLTPQGFQKWTHWSATGPFEERLQILNNIPPPLPHSWQCYCSLREGIRTNSTVQEERVIHLRWMVNWHGENWR